MLHLKSTCDVNLLSKLHYFQGMESYEQCGQGQSYSSLCTLDTIRRLFFVTRLIINKINQVQWVDFKLENVLVSLHSLKTMGLGSIIFKEWKVTWTFFYTSCTCTYYCLFCFSFVPSLGVWIAIKTLNIVQYIKGKSGHSI